MTTIVSAMLDCARLVTPCMESVATGGTTATLVDTTITAPTGTYNGGTLFLLSGTNIGKALVITTQVTTTITISTTLAAAIVAGDEYAVINADFPKAILQPAVKHVLKKTDVPAKTTGTASAGEITLVAGVNNVRRVILDDEENFHWVERAGVIYFDNSDASGSAVIWYLQPADELAAFLAAPYTISDAIDPNYLSWGAAVWLYRQLIQRIHKDNPTAVDLFNECKMNEAQALQMQRRYTLKSLPRAPRYSNW